MREPGRAMFHSRSVPHRALTALALAGPLAWAFSPASALACKPASVSGDEFAVPGAGLPSAAALDRGRLTLTVPAGQFGTLLDAHAATPDGEFCADISSPAGGDDRDAGISFWATRAESGAPHDFYAFSVGPRGNFAAQRMQGGELHLIASGKATKPSTGGPVSYEMRVKLNGRRATLMLDGTVIAQFEGAPPGGTAYAGIFAEASASRNTPWTFANVHTGSK